MSEESECADYQNKMCRCRFSPSRMKPKKTYNFFKRMLCYGHHHLELKETEIAK